MATFVICHGAWNGGWFWKEPALELQKLGHEVYRATLTGLGERQHLGTPETNLDTHIQDVVNLLEFEQLSQVVLVGHSYGGAVITGVAQRIPEKIQQLIYVDALVLDDGQSVADLYGDSSLPDQMRELAMLSGDGWKIPFPDSPENDPRTTAQPMQTLLQPLVVNNSNAERLPRTYVACTERGDAPHYAPIANMAKRAQRLGWQYFELPTGHNPNRTMPHETALLLHRLAQG